jgi:hypothetical protein
VRLGAGLSVLAALFPSTLVYAFCPGEKASLRIMTFNAHCTDTTWEDTEDGYGMEQEVRALLMCDRIAAIDPDIVVIVGCFQNSARDSYLRWLSRDYPSRVEWLNNTWDNQDSGMMLLSKFPFIRYDNPYFPPDVDSDFIDGVIANKNSFDQSDGYVAWHYYEGDQIMGSDACSARMAAMVRILTPSSERDALGAPRQCPVNVAFTHLQADYGDDDKEEREEHQDARRSSLLQSGSMFQVSVEKMITSTLTPDQRHKEAVFLVGDLNIDGNFGEYQRDENGHFVLGPDGYPLGVENDFRPLPRCRSNIDGEVSCGPRTEWDDIFSQNDTQGPLLGIFYRCGFNGFTDDTRCRGSSLFTDSWAFEHPRTDVGQTVFDDPGNQDFLDGEDVYFTGTRFDNASDGFRLDYILHNQPEDARGIPYFCMQHIQRMWWDIDDSQFEVPDPSFKDTKNLSHHLALFADVSFERSERCNPKLRSADGGEAWFGSEQITWGEEQDEVRTVTIDYDHDHAWFLIDEEGSYSIGVEEVKFDDVRIDVYHHTDLSGPIDTYHQETIKVGDRHQTYLLQPYVFLEPPYYIRISNKAPVPSSQILEVMFRQHRCTNPNNDYCPLVAGDLGVTVGWPTDKVHSTDFDPLPDCDAIPSCDASEIGHNPKCDPLCCQNNETWYGETQDGAFDGDYMFFVFGVDKSGNVHPSVEFHFELSDPGQFNLLDASPGRGAQVFDWKSFHMKQPDNSGGINVPISGGTWSDMGDGTFVLDMNNDSSPHALSPSSDVYRAGLIRVNRRVPDGETPTLSTMKITYRESLKSVMFTELIGWMTDDEPSDEDEIILQMGVDNQSFGTCGDDPWDPQLKVFKTSLDDDGDQVPIGHEYDMKFTSQVKARMCEEDLFDDWDDHYTSDMILTWQGEIPLEWDGKHRPPYVFTDDPNVSWEDSEWHHHLKFIAKNEDQSTEFEGNEESLTCP